MSNPYSDTQLATLGQESLSSGALLAIRRGFWKSTAGGVYAAITPLVAGNFQVIFNKTTDSGISWTALTAITAATFGDTTAQWASIATDSYSNRIYVLMVTSNAGPVYNIRVGYWTMDTDIFTVLGSQPSITAVNGTVISIQATAIWVDSTNGDITVFMPWGYNVGQNSYRAQYCDYTAGSWGAQTEIPGQDAFPNPNDGSASQSFAISQVFTATSGRMYVFIYDTGGLLTGGFPAGGVINGYCITRESHQGSWNTLQKILTTIPYTTPLPGSNAPQFPFGLGGPYSGGVIVPFLSGFVTNGSPGIQSMVLQSVNAADVANPTFSTANIDTNIGNGNAELAPTYYPFQDVYASIVSVGGTAFCFWWSATSLAASHGFTRAASGDIRSSSFSGAAWAAFTTYRSFLTVDSLVPAGVFTLDSKNAMYFLIPNGSTTQTQMAHFLGPFVIPPPPSVPIITTPQPTRRLPVLINKLDLCLARDFSIYTRRDPTYMGCARKPECFCNLLTGDEDELASLLDNLPVGTVTWNPQTGIITPVPGETIIFTEYVPEGYDGIILGQMHNYLPLPAPIAIPQFVEGSGDLIWRVKCNLRYLKDCGEILVQLGSIPKYSPIYGGLQVYSGDIITYIVNAVNTSGSLIPGEGTILAGLHGYFYPRK